MQWQIAVRWGYPVHPPRIALDDDGGTAHFPRGIFLPDVPGGSASGVEVLRKASIE
jgi:hypothetical protein